MLYISLVQVPQKFFLNAGPYFAYGIGGKDLNGKVESDKIKFGSGRK